MKWNSFIEIMSLTFAHCFYYFKKKNKFLWLCCRCGCCILFVEKEFQIFDLFLFFCGILNLICPSAIECVCFCYDMFLCSAKLFCLATHKFLMCWWLAEKMERERERAWARERAKFEQFIYKYPKTIIKHQQEMKWKKKIIIYLKHF